MGGGGVKVPPKTFPYICPTDGPILMSDIPKCSEIYAGPDAADIVAITWRMCARKVENRKYPVFQPWSMDLPNIAHHGQDSWKVLYCILILEIPYTSSWQNMAPKVVHHEDVGLETGSSYSDVCVIDGHAVSSAKVGFVTTPSVSAPFSNVGDVTEALIQGPTRRCRPRNRK